MAVANFAPESNHKLGRRPVIIFICSLLLPLACVVVGNSTAQAAVQKRAKRPAVRSVTTGNGVRRRQRTQRRKRVVASAVPVPEPRRAEVGEDIEGRAGWFLLKRTYPF